MGLYRGDKYRLISLVLFIILLCYMLHDLYGPQTKHDNDGYLSRKGMATNYESGKPEPLHFVSYEKNTPLIWIGGVPRSGTTLARAMLDSHPDIRCGEETRVIPRLLFMHTKMQMSQIEKSRLNEAKVTEEVLDAALGSYILNIIVKHGELANRLCNKDPFALKSMDKLLQIFPKSKFLLMIRDGRAVVHSIIERKITISGFDTKTYRGALRDWNRAIDLMYKKCLKLGTTICLPVNYEHLVLHPESQMKRILEFLDVPWNSIVLHHEMTIGKSGGISLSKRERSTDQVNKPVNTEALYKWAKYMPLDVQRDMATIAPMLKVLGYDPNSNPPKYGLPDQQVAENTRDIWEQKKIKEFQVDSKTPQP